MKTAIVEVTNGPINWGKFMIGVLDVEHTHPSAVAPECGPLLKQIGWGPAKGFRHFLLVDIQTGEGAFFKHGGNAHVDLEKRRIWCCHLFEPLLDWLYAQPWEDVRALRIPPHIDMPPNTGVYAGRRPGK